MVVVPSELTRKPYELTSLDFEGLRVIQSCTHIQQVEGSMFLTEHLWLFLRKGTYVLEYGKETLNLQPGSSAFIRKGVLVDYIKEADAVDQRFDCLLFFIGDRLVKEFLKLSPNLDATARPKQITKIGDNKKLAGYVRSVEPFFATEYQSPAAGLLKLKMLELLFDLATEAPEAIQVLLGKAPYQHESLAETMESNYLKRLSVEQFATLSGRSLSSFKREFREVFNCPPALWLRRKRLAHASYLLQHTSLSIGEIGFRTGFDSQAHFSRVFKSVYGSTPSQARSCTEPIRQTNRAF
jgi:AraC family transcriptional regulator, exoenzyme S synthesis regulatory protein ExsA